MILDFIFILLAIYLFILFFIPETETVLLKNFSIWVSSFVLIFTTYLLINFQLNTFYFQNLTSFNLGSSLFNVQFFFAVDGISILFIFLTTFLFFLCTIFIWHDKFLKFYLINLFFLELLLLLVFSTLDILLFYIFFEAILIPMFFLIGIWGSRERKIRAAYLLFFYTLVTSLIMLSSLLYIYFTVGTFNLEYILAYPFSFQEQFWLWLAFFFSLASKIPMFPFHIWLPEAHVEAPTIGSVILAGVLLKIGVYGFIRFNIGLFFDASLFFSPLVSVLALIGIIYASFTAIRQTDLKRIIAYSSIAHMNLVVLGLFSFNNIGLEGAIIQSISHGFVSGALFLLVGILYDRYHSRLLMYYSGLVHIMPIYAGCFLFFTMANIALPGTSSFIGEFLLLLGTFKYNATCCFIAALSVIISGAYSLWLSNRLLFGNIKIKFTNKYKDINIREFFLILPLIIFVLLLGILPNIVSKFIQTSYIYTLYIL
jgi:proton-translocating NADH-quinone oxidoreductase chain M